MSKPDVFPSGVIDLHRSGRSRRQEVSPGKLGMGGVIGLDLPVPKVTQWVSSTVLGPHIQRLQDHEGPLGSQKHCVDKWAQKPSGRAMMMEYGLTFKAKGTHHCRHIMSTASGVWPPRSQLSPLPSLSSQGPKPDLPP